MTSDQIGITVGLVITVGTLGVGMVSGWWTSRASYKDEYYLVEATNSDGSSETYRTDNITDTNAWYSKMAKKYEKVTVTHKPRNSTTKVLLASVNTGTKKE